MAPDWQKQAGRGTGTPRPAVPSPGVPVPAPLPQEPPLFDPPAAAPLPDASALRMANKEIMPARFETWADRADHAGNIGGSLPAPARLNAADRSPLPHGSPLESENHPAAGAEGNDHAGRSDARDLAPGEGLLRQGVEALVLGNTEQARACFREAIARCPHNPQIPISAAVESLRTNCPSLAIELLEPRREAFSDSAVFWRVLAAAYYRQGDFKASQTALEQALSLDKSSALSYFLMGCTLSKLGQPEAAAGHLRQAELIDPRYAVRR